MEPIKGHPAWVQTLQSLPPAPLLLSSVVMGQWKTGVFQTAWPERNRRQPLALAERPIRAALALFNWLR